MANILDYIMWRSDVPLKKDPFNEIDNLVFAELAYMDTEGIVGEKPVPIKDVCDAYFERFGFDEIVSRKSYCALAPFLMKEMLEGERFNQVKVSDYINIVDKAQEFQICATTYHLADKSIYVSFKGTDDTITAWKEDFDFCYSDSTNGQKKAVEYLENMARKYRGKIRVGGHSKGGNFAIYAAAFCDKKVKKRITDIYSNDGPGFRKSILATDEYRSIEDRITKIIPDSSLIGTLLYSSNYKVVKSTATGMTQHNAFTWQVNKNSFVATELTDAGNFAKQTTADWLEGMSDEVRESFVKTLFYGLEQQNIETFTQLKENKKNAIKILRSAIDIIPKDKKDELTDILKQLFKSGSKYMDDVLLEKVEWLRQKYND